MSSQETHDRATVLDANFFIEHKNIKLEDNLLWVFFRI